MSLHLRLGKRTSSPGFDAEFPPSILGEAEVQGSPSGARGTGEAPAAGAAGCGVSSTKLQTYRPIQLASLVHAEVESGVHPTDAHQPHCQANKLQNPWNREVQVTQRVTAAPCSRDKLGPASPSLCRASYRPRFLIYNKTLLQSLVVMRVIF